MNIIDKSEEWRKKKKQVIVRIKRESVNTVGTKYFIYKLINHEISYTAKKMQ